jgi:hypothetical protein
MPRYFFNIKDGLDRLNPIGTDLPDLDAVREEAMAASSEAIRQLGLSFWSHRDQWQMEVTDAAGKVVMRLEFFGKIDLNPS